MEKHTRHYYEVQCISLSPHLLLNQESSDHKRWEDYIWTMHSSSLMSTYTVICQFEKIGAVTRHECLVLGYFKAQAGRWARLNGIHITLLTYGHSVRRAIRERGKKSHCPWINTNFSAFYEICRELSAISWWLRDDSTDPLWAADSSAFMWVMHPHDSTKLQGTYIHNIK